MRNGLRIMESLVQGQLARRVRWGGCRDVPSERIATRCVLTQSLEERREAYRMSRISISYNDQSAQLPAIKEVRPEYKEIYSQILQDTLKRVDKAFKAFFKRCKEGKTPGFPRFQGYDRYDSFTYPQIEKLKGKPTVTIENGKVILHESSRIFGTDVLVQIARNRDGFKNRKIEHRTKITPETAKSPNEYDREVLWLHDIFFQFDGNSGAKSILLQDQTKIKQRKQESISQCDH